MGKIEGLAHLGFFVDDMDRSIQFYTDVLGFSLRCRWEVPGVKAALLDLGDCCLGISTTRSARSTGSPTHFRAGTCC